MQGWEAMPMQARSVTPRGGGADQEADHLLIASRAQWGSGRFMATRPGLVPMGGVGGTIEDRHNGYTCTHPPQSRVASATLPQRGASRF